MPEDKPIVVAKETTLFFPMLKDEPTIAAALSEPSLAATPKNTPNVHVANSYKSHNRIMRLQLKGKVTILIVYVDDIILTRDYLLEIKRLKEHLALRFEIKDLSPIRYFFGMEVAHSKKGIKIGENIGEVPIDTTQY
ncbi:hypothetical protein AAG906_037489 [Vitis piasezkii]